MNTTGEEWDEDTNYRQGDLEKEKERPSRGHVELSNLSSTPSALTGLRHNTASDVSSGDDQKHTGQTRNSQQTGDTSSSTFRPWGGGGAVSQVSASGVSGTDDTRINKIQGSQQSRDTSRDTFNILHANR